VVGAAMREGRGEQSGEVVVSSWAEEVKRRGVLVALTRPQQLSSGFQTIPSPILIQEEKIKCKSRKGIVR